MFMHAFLRLITIFAYKLIRLPIDTSDDKEDIFAASPDHDSFRCLWS